MNLHQKYQTEVRQQMKEELNITNPMAIPRLVKIVVNVGLGEALSDSKVIERVSEQLAIITGQKPALTRAKVSIAAFKLRAGDAIGLKVTMRGQRMYDFLEKLISIVLPRVRDFRGVSRRSFDGQGNYSLGLREQNVFSEIEYSKIDKARGLEVNFVTTAGDDKTAYLLLNKLGIPFEKESKK